MYAYIYIIHTHRDFLKQWILPHAHHLHTTSRKARLSKPQIDYDSAIQAHEHIKQRESRLRIQTNTAEVRLSKPQSDYDIAVRGPDDLYNSDEEHPDIILAPCDNTNTKLPGKHASFSPLRKLVSVCIYIHVRVHMPNIHTCNGHKNQRIIHVGSV